MIFEALLEIWIFSISGHCMKNKQNFKKFCNKVSFWFKYISLEESNVMIGAILLLKMYLQKKNILLQNLYILRFA